MKKIIASNLWRLPMWAKTILAKLFFYSLADLSNDVVLFNELKLWIETQGRPQTSNPNHWINSYKPVCRRVKIEPYDNGGKRFWKVTNWQTGETIECGFDSISDAESWAVGYGFLLSNTLWN